MMMMFLDMCTLFNNVSPHFPRRAIYIYLGTCTFQKSSMIDRDISTAEPRAAPCQPEADEA